MSLKYKRQGDSQWDDGEANEFWVFDMLAEVFKDNFSYYAFQEISYYLFLTVFSVVGFGILHHYNVRHEQKIVEIELEREEEENKKNMKENNSEIKHNLSKKID